MHITTLCFALVPYGGRYSKPFATLARACPHQWRLPAPVWRLTQVHSGTTTRRAHVVGQSQATNIGPQRKSVISDLVWESGHPCYNNPTVFKDIYLCHFLYKVKVFPYFHHETHAYSHAFTLPFV